MALSGPFNEDRLAKRSFYAVLIQPIDCVMSLAFCPQVVSQAPQHLVFSETQATCDDCLSASLSARSSPFAPACLR